MKTAAEFINEQGFATWYTQTSDTQGEVVINYHDCLQAMVEFAKEAIKADRENVAKHVKIKTITYSSPHVSEWDKVVDTNSIINAPEIELK